ncbi:MAG: hypothetical protein HYY42_02175 [Chloroflexi bacterium]|nr:hypothetical protein [Chloroflexota bacterium]
MTDLDDLGRKLAERLPVEERAGFREDLRARLLAQVGAAAVARQRRGPRLAWLRPLVVALGAVMLIVGTAGSAAAGSLPGEPAFVLKRAAEEIALALVPDDAARAERLVAQANARLTELRRAEPGSSTLGLAVSEYASAVERLAPLVEHLRLAPGDLRRAAALDVALLAARSHLTTLETLGDSVPTAAQPALRRAIDAGNRITVPADPAPDRAPGTVPPDATSGPRPGATAAPSLPAPERTPPAAPGRPTAVPSGPRSAPTRPPAIAPPARP